MSERRPDAVAAWLGGGLKTVMLPSGAIFAFRVPDAEELVAKQIIPDDLRKEALKFAASAVNVENMDTAALANLLSVMRSMVANSLRYIWNGPIEPIEAWEKYEPGESWQAVTITPHMLEESAVDPDDYAALQGIVSREFTARQITTMALVEHGIVSQADGDTVLAEERQKTPEGWASFRRERRGAAAGTSGAAVGKPPVGNRGDRRSGARARAR